MAYLKTIIKPECGTCSRPADVELFNRRNAVYGRYCRSCGARKLKLVKLVEREEAERALAGKGAERG